MFGISKERLKIILIFLVIFICIFTFAISTSNYGTVDTADYLGAAKGFAELSPTKMRSSHTWITGLVFGQILKVVPYLNFLKFLNVLVLVLTGVLVYAVTKSKKSILIFAFSPVVWYNSPAINGIQIAALLMFIGYIFFKKFEEDAKIRNLVVTGLLFGLANLFWDSSFFLTLFFILAFFYKKESKTLFIFLIAMALTSSIRLLVDYILFDFPFFSLIRFFGGQMAAFFGLGGAAPEASSLLFFRTPITYRLTVLFALSPLLFLIYRTNFKKYKAEFWFIILGLILFLLLGAQLRYLPTLLPISIVLLTDVIRKRELKWHVILSIILLISFIFAFGGFYNGKFEMINSDMFSIAEEFPNERFIIGEEELHQGIAEIYWGTDIKELIGWREYLISIGKRDSYLTYMLESNSKINDERKLKITFSLEKKDNQTYEEIDYLITTKEESPIDEFKLVKEYQLLKLYKRERN
ncbi:MAG: hypothetical protein ABIB47_06825 [Candidatus Woesearchaeota archaeon]